MQWLILILSLPTENATVRMRAWRALRAAGAAVLRDGVYLLPARDDCRLTLEAIGRDVQAGGGSTHLMFADEPPGGEFAAMFDRSDDYAALLNEIREVSDALDSDAALEASKQARKLRKTFAALIAIDFFGGRGSGLISAYPLSIVACDRETSGVTSPVPRRIHSPVRQLFTSPVHRFAGCPF